MYTHTHSHARVHTHVYLMIGVFTKSKSVVVLLLLLLLQQCPFYCCFCSLRCHLKVFENEIILSFHLFYLSLLFVSCLLLADWSRRLTHSLLLPFESRHDISRLQVYPLHHSPEHSFSRNLWSIDLLEIIVKKAASWRIR